MTLSLAHIAKRFGSTNALIDVTLSIDPGQVHALLGENGAGKTTLMQVAYGMIRPDAGEIRVDGAVRRFASPIDARAAGIGMVHQHFTSIPALTVGENVALAAGWRETGRAAERRSAELIARLGLPLDASARVGTLSVQLRQRLEIVKALSADARILLLDEPSAVLAPREVGELLHVVREFAGRGGAVVLITHKLEEVFQAADTITVLRRGHVTFAGPLAGQSPQSLARAMIGGDVPRDSRTPPVPGAVVVRAKALRLDAHGAGPPADFELRAGEIVGVAAIEGNGQRQLLRAIAGVENIMAGSLEVVGPVAFVPEDRTTEGLIPAFTLTENLMLGALDGAHGWLDWPGQRARAAEAIAAFDIRAAGTEITAAALSGGNQQKLVFARALARRPRVLVAEDPTRGLDVQATQAIHQRLRDAARDGVAVIVHSSDLDEVLALSDRLFVVSAGRIGELASGSSRDVVGDAMLGIGTA